MNNWVNGKKLVNFTFIELVMFNYFRWPKMISEIYFDLMVKRPTFLQSKTKRLLELREENKRHHFLPYKIKFSKILRDKNKTTSELLQQNHMVRFFNETLVITNQTILSHDTIDKRTKWDPVLQKKTQQPQNLGSNRITTSNFDTQNKLT